MERPLVLPSEIPWSDLQGRDLEESLYWLFDAMGAKELEWRVGGAGEGAPDGGRDIEATFHATSPDAEITTQRWWVEAKGRSKTVEKAAVQATLLNTAARTHIDVIVIATNCTFSNPTRDWVKEWHAVNPRPKVRLWDRTDLERLFSRYPEVVMRLFSGALSDQGQLEVISRRLWQYSSYAPKPTLEKLWPHRSDLQWDNRSLVAVLASEIANGSVMERPWQSITPAGDTLDILGSALLNALPFYARASRAGTDDAPYMRAVCLLILQSLTRFPAEQVAGLVETLWDKSHPVRYTQELWQMAIAPVIARLVDETADACGADCSRVHTKPMVLDHQQITTYWRRLVLTPEEVASPAEATGELIIEATDAPCDARLALDKNHCCPLFRLGERQDTRDIHSLFADLERIVKHRISGPSSKA